jgi:hypothetical protein
MLFLHAALNHRRIVLIDLAAERGNGDPHVFASVRISNARFQIAENFTRHFET